ncbi:MAG: ATP-binding protein [Pseudomonadota bacterium]
MFKGSLGLQTRLLLLTLLVLGASLSLAGWVLDRSFRASIEAGAREQLELVVYAVMGALEEADSGLFVPADAAEGSLSRPESGLYARVRSEMGELIWRSPSADLSGVEFAPEPGELAPGDFLFFESDLLAPNRYYLSYSVIWEDRGDEVGLVFTAAADTTPFDAQIGEFRRNLWLGLAGVAFVLMLVQLIAVRVGLRPVRVMAEEVAEMEAGQRSTLGDDYPRELAGLAENLDRFVENETASRARYRNALDDLAHSLKTPLAVIRNALADEAEPDRDLLRDQLARMETSVSHQLARAVSSGPVVVGHLVGVRAVVERLSKALATAYRDRGIDVRINGSPEIAFRGDERDLLEMLGNLLENAFKYTNSRVQVVCENTGELGLAISIEDDGPGIPASQQQKVLARGERGDTALQGQGIGLSMVADLVGVYGGELRLAASALGGAAVALELPGGRLPSRAQP